MRIYLSYFFYFKCLFVLISGNGNTEYDVPQEITFYHDVGIDKEAVWVKKEAVEMNNVNNGHVVISQDEFEEDVIEELEVWYDNDLLNNISFYHEVETAQQPIWVEKEAIDLNKIISNDIILSKAQISQEVMEKIKDEGLYRLKSVVKTAKGKEIIFYSFMKMSTLAEAGFQSSVFVYLDQSGSVVSVKLYPKRPDHLAKYRGNGTVITFKVLEQGPLPDLTSYLLKLERERIAKEKGANQDNRSFLSKYWMYIVPFIMFALLTGSNGEGGSQQHSSR